jgi:hypothetical protein
MFKSRHTHRQLFPGIKLHFHKTEKLAVLITSHQTAPEDPDLDFSLILDLGFSASMTGKPFPTRTFALNALLISASLLSFQSPYPLELNGHST